MPDNVNGVCTKEEAKLYYTSVSWGFGILLGSQVIIWDGYQHKIIPNLDHKEKGGMQDNVDEVCLHQGGIGE